MDKLGKRNHMISGALTRCAGLLFAVPLISANSAQAADNRPNVLFCFADDWGWPHAGAYGDPVVKTPAFDRVAREGVLFDNVYTAPSCTASRGSVLTGQWQWRLGESVNLMSSLDPKYPVYPYLMEDVGYFVGYCGKGWGPGDWKALGRTNDPAGPRFVNFSSFFSKRPEGKPFCFWFGSHDPHRPYEEGRGVKSGIDISRIKLPADLPDNDVVRSDVADYYFGVQRFDHDVAACLKLVEDAGELENTIVVISGDNGMPFPRHKMQIYDGGTRVPLAIRWGAKIPGGREVTDFVSLCDLAPTFLDVAGSDVPKEMTGRSLLNILTSEKEGRVDPTRDHVLVGRERHCPSQEKPNMGGYPARGIRTDGFFYIRNLCPDRWPTGCPDPRKSVNGTAYADCSPCPTKYFVLDHRNDPKYRKFFDLFFAQRPGEELYDLKKDPDQLHNLAGQPEYSDVRKKLSVQLMNELTLTKDPRIIGGGDAFDTYPYRMPSH